MKNSLKTSFGRQGDASVAPLAHLGIAPGVVEAMVVKAASDVPGVAAVGGPKVRDRKRFTSVISKDGIDGVSIHSDEGDVALDIDIQILYGHKLQDIVDGIKISVCDALSNQAGIDIDAINIHVTALCFEE